METQEPLSVKNTKTIISHHHSFILPKPITALNISVYHSKYHTTFTVNTCNIHKKIQTHAYYLPNRVQNNQI